MRLKRPSVPVWILCGVYMSNENIDQKEDVLEMPLTMENSEGDGSAPVTDAADNHSTVSVTEMTDDVVTDAEAASATSEVPETEAETAPEAAEEGTAEASESEAETTDAAEGEASNEAVNDTEAAADEAVGAVADTAAAEAAATSEGAAETESMPAAAVEAGTEDTLAAEEAKKQKRKKILKICGGVAAVIAVIYCIIAFSYKSKFITGTIINGIDASGMTKDQYEEALTEKVESYVLTMKFRNKVSEKIKGTDVGYTYVSDNAAEKLLSEQNIFAWARGYFGLSKELTVDEGCKFDEKKMSELATALPELQFENMEVPTNAHLGVNENTPEGEELQFEIIPETYGTQLIPSTFSEAVIEAAKAGVQEYDVDEAGLYVEPSIYSDDPYLKDSIGGFNEFLSTSVTYNLPNGQQEVLDASVLKNWIAMREDGVQYLNEDIVREHVDAYVALLAKNVDDVHHDRILHSTLQGDVSFDSETWGHKIDQETERAALLADIQNHSVVEREPAYSLNWTYAENFGGTYVEVDIENQSCFYYENGELCWSSECVTGTGSNPSRRTVRGIFSILNKQQGRTLRGPQLPDGSYTYESYVNYWMQFYEGYGLHDATWRSNYEFGGDTYWYSGSHGCVNLPYYAAESLYFMVSTGTYVLVF